MLQSLHKTAAVPRVPGHVVFSVGTVMSFVWLLANDLIHPFVMYLLQIYLSF
jgi:hypothetical protein